MISRRGAFTLPWVLAFNAATIVVCRAEQLPRFEDYPVATVFDGKPAPPKLTSPGARMFRTRIRDGVEKGWGVYRHDGQQDKPGPNFAGHYIVIRWGCGSPCLRMAIVDAKTGAVISPPITATGIGKAGLTCRF